MMIKALNVYPIKALRPIHLTSAILTPQGILHDRTYMLFKVNPDSTLRKMQLSTFPQCALFSQEIVASADRDDKGDEDKILVKYNIPTPPLIDHHPLQDTILSVPLVPDTSSLESVSVDLHGSPAEALRMGESYDTFFSACFGFPTILVHIGSGRRRVLGTLAPGSSSKQQQQQQQQQSSSLFTSITSYLPSLSFVPKSEDDEQAWLTFTDCAPFLITSDSSLSYPSLTSFQTSDKPSPIMPKFRPNIVVEDSSEAPFAEDFWAELSLPDSSDAKLLLTANCGRCTSLNVDYALGRAAPGPEGKLLNTLMKDRRVDPGHKYAPVFGRYAFLEVPVAGGGDGTVQVRVGDQVVVTRRNAERTVFDWDIPGPAAKKTVAVA
ncbi:MOSC domain-containing protein [Colletotrichum orchidophilum]|uniref:MOSC domain-containing protein n=1 Tax=Colletotrichum orchidophilum TaxID=1209926 RepID=A0A1G4BLH7_9PEZI|nr:MOSC domain-containing protein [Colletotrichum orchidophilum]OHF02147.1 MOSC domain-containing protein [Colletotrichum orchidophilum]